jgi:hypothetical protein
MTRNQIVRSVSAYANDRNRDYSRHNANDDPRRLVRMPVLHLGCREYLIVSDLCVRLSIELVVHHFLPCKHC